MSEKYPRTPHLPWSPGLNNTERKIEDVFTLIGREIIITEKADGSNVCLESEAVYARSHADTPRHISFDALKARHAAIRMLIPEGWQIFGEWLWARHSIAYHKLPDYLLLFGIRESTSDVWLSWDELEEWSAAFSLQTVPVLWRGVVSSEAELRRLTVQLTAQNRLGAEQEGLVVRICESFPDAEFHRSIAKWVRADHVQTDTHWSEQAVNRNILACDKGTK